VKNIHEILEHLSEDFGIEDQYTNNWGQVIRTPPEVALGILGSKGVLIDSNLFSSEPQVLVVSQESIPRQWTVFFRGITIEGLLEAREATVRIVRLEGQTQELMLRFDQDQRVATAMGCTGLLGLSIPFPQDLDLGRNELRVELIVGETNHWAQCLCFVCPATAFLHPALEQGARLAGVGIALYGVRSRTNWGVGDFSDLRKIIDWAAEDLHVDFVGLNPLHALFNARPFNSSPYLPSSRLYRNVIYLDVTAIPDFADSAGARELVGLPETQRRIERLRQEEHVDYEEVSALKLEILRKIYRSFLENAGRTHRHEARWREFEHYRNSEGVYLERYATFCALRDHFRSGLPSASTWRQWPAPFQDPLAEEVRQFQQEREEEILFRMYVQWQLDEQLKGVQEYALGRGMLVGLYHDEALAVDKNGADFWAWREFFHEGFRVGAPPDAFAPTGQDWGFPPPDRERLRASGYAPFLKKLETNCSHGGALRIDHVMQMHHLFWIPSAGAPKDGVYVKDHEAELLNLLALVSRQCQTMIVGEDLGTVPFEFRDRLMVKKVFSYRLFYFERDLGENLIPYHQYPQSALVSVSTHDLPTLAGFWGGEDIDKRRDMGLLDSAQEAAFREDRTRHKSKIIERLVADGCLPEESAHAAWESSVPTEELHTAVLKFLFQTPAMLVIINQEDVFLDARQQNFPGTTVEHPNWVTKMRFTVEELRSHPEATRLSARFRQLIEEAGRAQRP